MSDQDGNTEGGDPGHNSRLHPGPAGAANAMPSGSRTQTVTLEETQSAPTVHLKLKKPKKKKRVGWTEETVDNEGMGKRKSKCCCIYKRPQVFGESSDSSDDDDCDNCGGHKHHRDGNSNNNNGDDPPPSTVS